MAEEHFVLTCDKESVYLSRDKANHMYLIEYQSQNQKYGLMPS